MNQSQDAESKTQKAIAQKRASPFREWGRLRPSQELEDWRKVNEPIIEGALRSREQLETLVNMLTNDVCVFCDACDAVKCWGTIYPICQPVLKKFADIVEK